MVRIVIDTTSDFTAEEAKEKNLYVAPLQIIFGEEQYIDGIEITKEMFYKKLVEGKVNPKTSQPSPEKFYKLYEEAKENGDDVVVLTIASTLSGTYQSAVTAKNMIEYDRIYPIDSLLTTAPLRILVEYACELRDQGKSGKEIYDEIMELRKKTKVRIVPDTLDYLYRGGRLSKKEKILGNLLSIKPIIRLNDDGTVGVCGKARGHKTAVKNILEDLKSIELDDRFPICLAYTTGKEALDRLREAVQAEFPTARITYTQIGPVVGTHVGPDSYAIGYVMK